MAWTQILTTTQTEGSVFSPSQPFIIRLEGTLGTKILTFQSRRIGATNWVTEQLGTGNLNDNNPNVVFGGIPDTEYRFTIDSAGVDLFFNSVYTSRIGS